MVGPRFWDHHQRHVVKGAASQVEKLERVVELSAVGAVGVDDLLCDFGQVGAEQIGLEDGLAGVHPVDIAADRVDFAVVDQIAVGVGPFPGGEGVGAEARVHDGDRGGHVRVEQVWVIGVDLVGEQHAFVDDGAAGEAGDVEAVGLLVAAVAQGLFGAFADDIELAFEGERVVADECGGVAADKDLADEGFAGDGGGPERVVAGRHGAPAEQLLAFLLENLGEGLLELGTASVVFGQKDHPYSVVAERGQGKTSGSCHLAQE